MFGFSTSGEIEVRRLVKAASLELGSYNFWFDRAGMADMEICILEISDTETSPVESSVHPAAAMSLPSLAIKGRHRKG